MINNIKQIVPIIKNGAKCCFCLGFSCGFIFPNKISITKYTNGNKIYHLSHSPLTNFFYKNFHEARRDLFFHSLEDLLVLEVFYVFHYYLPII